MKGMLRMAEYPPTESPRPVRHIGPAVVLCLAAGLTLIFGPAVMRDIAHADQQAQVQLAASKLAQSSLADLNEAFSAIAEAVEPSVVHVSVARKAGSRSAELPPGFERMLPPEFRDQMPDDDAQNPFDRYNRPQTVGNGSGWVYDKQGHIITNYHVVKDADYVEVTFFDKTMKEANVVGVDPNTDVAVLKIDKTDHLIPARMGERSPRQGEMVFAFGSPFGEAFSFSMSQGIVSGKQRRLGILGSSGYENFIQTDAAINPGNSGGPLTNIRGEVIGMNTAIASRTRGWQGLGFAIPTEMLQKIIPQLIAEGAIARGYLGVGISDDPRLLRSFGVDQGVVVESVMEDTPAEDAGLERGDVIIEVNDTRVRDANHLRGMIADAGPDAEVELTIIRNGDQDQVEVELGELPAELAGVTPVLPGRGDDSPGGDVDTTNLRKLGIEKAEQLTRRMAQRLNVEHEDGVVVTEVRRGSVAAAEGLSEGMLITEVAGEPVEDLEELVDELAEHDLKQGVRLTVKQWAGGRWMPRFVVLELP
jgi:serine protease Do